MDYKLTIHYYLRSDKITVKGLYPIYLRVTLNGKRVDISTNKSTIPENWNKYAERAKGNREDARTLNNYLSSQIQKVQKHFNDLLNSGDHFNVNDLKDTLNGKGRSNKTLIKVYEEHNQLLKKEAGHKFAKNTVAKYFISIERLKKFVQVEYGIQDISLNKLNFQFIQRYKAFLRL